MCVCVCVSDHNNLAIFWAFCDLILLQNSVSQKSVSQLLEEEKRQNDNLCIDENEKQTEEQQQREQHQRGEKKRKKERDREKSQRWYQGMQYETVSVGNKQHPP